MKLEEAIEELRKDTQHPTAKYMPDLLKAIQLGIEALELINKWRERTDKTKVLMIWRSEIHEPLPSETED